MRKALQVLVVTMFAFPCKMLAMKELYECDVISAE